MKVRRWSTIDWLPPQADVEKRLLVHLSLRMKPVTAHSVYGPLADDFKLSGPERKAHRPTEARPAWENLVRHARRRLVDYAMVVPTKVAGHDQWLLTPKGREAAARVAEGGPMFTTLNLDELDL